MKNILTLFFVIGLYFHTYAQSESGFKIGWFINPEVGGILHTNPNHFGTTLGGALGVKLFKERLKIGWQMYGRPGPINPQEFVVTPSDGQTYKGQSTITIRADQGAAGLFIAPVFNIQKIKVEIPIAVGQMGAGFYLTGEDRDTPDGARVSVWEDRLMDSRDAGFSTWFEFGARVFVPLKHDNIGLGAGVHYTLVPNWETYADPSGELYNNRIRVAMILAFESNKP
ncbi:MAG: hypothetical protein AAGH79_03025 [Bacteroidota bacterium]